MTPSRTPLLTLAIPTYNRSTYLANLLTLLASQFTTDLDVELLISDNSSPDDTPAIVEEFRRQGLPVRYIRNATNIGPDANFLQCFNQAAGKYFWLLGDDDVIVPDALRHIVSLLQQGEQDEMGKVRDFDLVYLSSFAFADTYNPAQARPRPRLTRYAEVFTSGTYFLSRVHGLVGLISCIIVNKDRLGAYGCLPIRDLDRTNIAQLGWVLPLIREKVRILYVWERLLGYFAFNSAGWGPCQVFGINVPRAAAHYFGLDSALTASLNNGLLSNWLPAAIVEVRLQRHPGLLCEDCAKLLRPTFGKNWRYWVFIYPASALPIQAAKLVHAVTLALNRSSRILVWLLRRLLYKIEYYEPN